MVFHSDVEFLVQARCSGKDLVEGLFVSLASCSCSPMRTLLVLWRGGLLTALQTSLSCSAYQSFSHAFCGQHEVAGQKGAIRIGGQSHARVYFGPRNRGKGAHFCQSLAHECLRIGCRVQGVFRLFSPPVCTDQIPDPQFLMIPLLFLFDCFFRALCPTSRTTGYGTCRSALLFVITSSYARVYVHVRDLCVCFRFARARSRVCAVLQASCCFLSQPAFSSQSVLQCRMPDFEHAGIGHAVVLLLCLLM